MIAKPINSPAGMAEINRRNKAAKVVDILRRDGMPVRDACLQVGITENQYYAIKKKARR